MAAARQMILPSLVTARRHAISCSLFRPTTLQAAIERLGFVQADPIRSPARAQDLILRQRVNSYRAGDLEREYPALDIEEDYLYAYGFLARPVWNLLHPRSHGRMGAFERKVLDTVRALGEVHPADLEAHLGHRRVVNAWGGYSKATTRALEELHYRGLVRIARREKGIRVYKHGGTTARHHDGTTTEERLRALIMVIARIFAPSPARTLHAVVSRYRYLGDPRAAVKSLIEKGELCAGNIDGVGYLWPDGEPMTGEPPGIVRFLAPFDPVVWDRARFEHLWGWPYRFEAYTPVPKRIRGYYAMPMLWGDEFVGWVNASLVGAGVARRLEVKTGFVRERPRERAFARAFDAEVARLETFLAPGPRID